MIEFGDDVVAAVAGDLLVCYRLSRFQRVSNLNGDPCTHVAVLDVFDQQVMTIEMGPVGVFSRSFSEFAAAYEWIAVMHLDANEQERRALLADARRRLEAGRMRYSVGDCAHIAFFGLARRVLPARLEPRVADIALSSAERSFRRNGDEVSTCSGLIAQILDVAMPDWRASAWPVRRRVAAWRRAPAAVDIAPIDVLPQDVATGALNVLISPSDLFITVPSISRTVIGPDRLTELPGVRLRQRAVATSVVG